MAVEEMIEKLQQYPATYEVVIYGPVDSWVHHLKIDEIYEDKKGHELQICPKN